MNYSKKFLIIIALLASFYQPAVSQLDDRTLLGSKRLPGINPDSYFSKPVQLVDAPTASILQGGDINTSIRLFEQGGALGELSVGISNKAMFGISFGGANIIGSGNVDWNQAPGIHFMYRMIEEDLVMPALVLGFDSQGYGPYWDKTESAPGLEQPPQVLSERYAVKSKGFFCVVSKGYSSLLKMGLHGGVNYSLEDSDEDKSPTVFIGMDAMLSRDIALIAEYDLAANDDLMRKNNDDKGYFNAGVRWAFTDYMFIEFDFKNILAAKDNKVTDINRIIKFVYYGTIK